jgi:hypothetical protein
VTKPGTTPGHGGARPGSGRPPRSELRKSPERLVAEQIEETLGSIRKVGITGDLVREMAMQGLATIYHHSRRGNLKASMYLVDRLLGTPDKPYSEQLEEQSPDEVKTSLVEILTHEGGFSAELATRIVEVLAAASTPEPTNPLQALPTPREIEEAWEADYTVDALGTGD